MGMRQPDRRARVVPIAVIAVVALAGAVGARMHYDWTPAHIEIERDTLRFYGAGFSRVPYRVLNSRGERLGMAPTFSQSDSILETGQYSFSCQRQGATDVGVVVERVTARIHVICRWPRAILGPTALRFARGDAPVPARFKAEFPNGEVAAIRPFEMGVGDSLVARLVDGHVEPVGVGRTYLHADLGGSRIRVPIEVQDHIARDTLALRPGEFRRWSLVAGRYEITVKSLTGARSFEELELFAEGTKCVPSREGGDMIHCLVKDSAVVILQNRSAAGAASARTAVGIVRTQ